MKHYSRFAAAAVVALLGCSDSVGVGSNPALAAQLRKAPTSLQLGPVTLTAAAYLWRDFMPVSESNGMPLAGVFTVRTQDPSIHMPVNLDAAWVLNGDMVWKAPLEFDPLLDPAPGSIVMKAYNGPKWAPGTIVDVVVQVSATDGSPRFIRVAGVVIQRTD